MKYNNDKKKKGGSFKRVGKKGSDDRDPFFSEETKKRRKVSYADDDEDIESVEYEDGKLVEKRARNGFVHLLAVEAGANAIRPLFKLPLAGYVNSLAFVKSGKFLIAGVGQETKVGRWGCLKLHPLRLS